VQLSTPLKRS